MCKLGNFYHWELVVENYSLHFVTSKGGAKLSGILLNISVLKPTL